MRRSASRLALLAVFAAMAGVSLFSAATLLAGVAGSPHDFSANGPYTQSATIAPSGACSACHIPHGADVYALWSRDLTDYRSLLVVNGGGTYQINYVHAPTIQCYDCHDNHTTGNIDANPASTAFSSNHTPQDIAFGGDGPQGVAGYYENNPPDKTALKGADPNLDPDNSVQLARTGGHYFKYVDPDGAGSAFRKGDKLPCRDCHDPHQYSNTWWVFIRADLPNAGDVTLSPLYGSELMTNLSTGTHDNSSSRKICVSCHSYSNTSTLPVQYSQIGSWYTDTTRVPKPPTTVAQHSNSSAVSSVPCVLCHKHNHIDPSCSQCHGDVGGAIRGDSTGFPPQGPQNGTGGWTGRSWAELQATAASRGDHLRHAGSAFYGKTCTSCHTTSAGSDAAHATDKTNATMTGVATYGTWSAGTQTGDVSVTDDSCADITCHSPYSTENSGNVYMSGTPFAYTRYWADNVNWNCYTCHAYDGRTQNTGSVPRPGGTDNVMRTGSHSVHVDNTQMACTRCHPSGSYDVNHKSGFVDWSFAGSPDPYADTEAYSVASGTRAPTDNAAGRLYGDCSNLYCHSAVQSSPPGTAPAHSTPTWGTASTGNCGTCHGGDGATDNAASLMAAGTHTVHDNLSTYRIGCAVCHTSAGTQTALHADGLIQVYMGGTWNYGAGGRSIALVAANTVFDNDASGATPDDNLAMVNADTAYGRCWGGTNLYCHSDGLGGAPVVDPAVWGATDPTCTYCHKGNVSSGNAMSSGKHTFHDNNASLLGSDYACGRCHAGTLSTGNDQAITVYDNHVNGTRNVRFSEGTGTWSTPTCSDTYCHQQGQPLLGANDNLPVTWTEAAWTSVCKGCHGSKAVEAGYSFASVTGEPNYDNNIVAGARNSHRAHVVATDNTTRCAKCHPDVSSATVNQITNGVQHINDNVEVASGAGATFTWDSVAHTCSSITGTGCHGGGTATWGDRLGCDSCHTSTSDVDNFGYNDGTLAAILMAGEWDTTGHGRTTAFPSTASGNPAPNDGTRFGSGATPNCVNYCHDSGQPHTDNNAGSNYFRLATGQGTTGRVAITQATANNICNQCHTTGGAYAAQATRDIVTAHYGSKHDNTTKNAGNFCWDCHEPHGDANDYMIQATVATRTDMSTSPGGIGIPLATSAVSFLKSGGSSGTAYDWGDYVGTVSGDTNRLCRVCHDSTVNHFNTATWDNNHNPGTRCTSCHGDTYKHDIDFRGLGTCVGCHSGAQGSSPARRVVTGASGDFSQATHHVTNYADNTADGAVQNVDCSKCHWEGYLTDDTILAGRTPAKQGDTNPAFHWTDDANNATAKYVQLRVWSTASAPIAYSNTAGTGSAIEWRNGTANNPVTEAINLNRHCLGCHSSTIGAGTPFSDGRSPRVRAWDGVDVGTKYLRNEAANVRLTHQYNNTTYNVVPPLNKALSPHYDLQNNQRGVATTGAWATDDTAGVSNTATGTVACFDCHNSHGSNVAGTATLPLVSYGNNATLNAGLQNANVGGLFKATTNGVSGYTTSYSPVANTTWNWSAGSAACFDCHVGSTAGGTPPKTYVDFGRTATQLVAGYYDPVDWGGTVAAGQGVWDNRRWSGSFAYKANNIVVTHFKNDATVRALQTTPTTQLNGLCAHCHDPHGVTTNTTMVSNANYGTPALKGTWMTSPYFEDRPGESPTAAVTTQRLATSNNWSFNNRAWIGTSSRGFVPRAIPYRAWNRPPVVGGGYGTSGGGTGASGFFIDENTFGLTLTGGTVAFDMFGSTTPGGTNDVWANLWNGGYGVAVTININRITETNAQFAGLCERCHTAAALVNTASKAANIITHAHRTVKGWDALAGGPAAADIFKNHLINNTTNSGAFSQRVLGAWAWNNMASNFSDYRVIEDPSEPWSGFPFHWGVNLNRTGGQFVNNYIQTNYHQFPCSKCHAPHTSRLPRLLRTNCLDTGTVRGATGGSSNTDTVGSWVQRHSLNTTNNNVIRFRMTTNATYKWTPARAVRCHQDAYAINGTAANDTRWNDLTPW